MSSATQRQCPCGALLHLRADHRRIYCDECKQKRGVECQRKKYHRLSASERKELNLRTTIRAAAREERLNMISLRQAREVLCEDKPRPCPPEFKTLAEAEAWKGET